MNKTIGISIFCVMATAAMFALPGGVKAETTQEADMRHAIDQGSLQTLDNYVEQVRKEFDVPGIALAIVQNDHVLYEKGFGRKDINRNDAVNEHTLFAIASNTKAFTAASISILIDEGKLKIDDRVIDHLPWFRMSDPYVTNEMRIRDLLAHRSGLSLGAGDLLFWPTTTYTNREVAERLRNVPLKGSFRNQYAYDNILYGVAQLVIEEASGMPFKQFLQTKIFTPLQMTETRYNADDLKPSDNVATGHAKYDFKDLKTVPPLTWSNVAGAGGLYSSVHDMSKWMRMQLNHGRYTQGQQQKSLFSEKRQSEMWSVITPIQIAPPSVPELAEAVPNFAGYGEGWSLSDYQGHKLVWHTGGWPGMVSRLTLVPELNVGVVVLTNQESGAAFNAITMRVLDMALNRPDKNWIEAYSKSVAKAKQKAEETMQKESSERNVQSKPALPIERYAGIYNDAWYGDIVITQNKQGKLEIQFSKTAQLRGELEHWQYDTFVVRWFDRALNADAYLTFDLDEHAKIKQASMRPISSLTDFSFDFQDLTLRPVDKTAQK